MNFDLVACKLCQARPGNSSIFRANTIHSESKSLLKTIETFGDHGDAISLILYHNVNIKVLASIQFHHEE